ncbi:MAG TPA: zinc ribbon domain-containing protein [bacterium]|nr:zinc ribbon domain-containing protein [bacterium]
MKDHLIICPLCTNEIPFDSTQCPYCGALLSPGPTRSTPILKGVVCLKCGEKNYSYDECAFCGHPFTVTCPECGGELRLKDQQCPQCNLSIRKFSATRRKTEKATHTTRRRRKLPGDKWTYIAPIALAVIVVIVAVIFSLSGGEQTEPEEETIKAGQPKAIDSNGDGVTDRWDVFSASGKVGERRFDENNDKIVEKIEYYDEAGVVRYAQLDENGDGVYELSQVFNTNGKLTMAYSFNGEDRRPIKIDYYSAAGNLIERWADTNGDYIFDRYFRYDARGRMMAEGSDTKGNGFIDLVLVYRGEKQIYQREYDLEGDGIFEKVETLNGDGIRIILDEDTDGNGIMDQRTFFHLTGKTRWVQLDTDSDGIHDTFKSFTQDGEYARTGVDSDGDGKPDQWK